jgi:hypothetical protein
MESEDTAARRTMPRRIVCFKEEIAEEIAGNIYSLDA